MAFLNRRQLWIGKRDLDRALEDSRRSIQLAREIGFVAASFMGEYNLAELLYQAGDADGACPMSGGRSSSRKSAPGSSARGPGPRGAAPDLSGPKRRRARY